MTVTDRCVKDFMCVILIIQVRFKVLEIYPQREIHCEYLCSKHVLEPRTFEISIIVAGIILPSFLWP